MSKGVSYQAEDNHLRSRVLRYHEASRLGLPFRDHNKTDFSEDLTHLPSRAVDMTIAQNEDGEYSSYFSIGFEVEKNSFHRSAIKEYALFSHFEYDSSCGVEAVTNILPLVGASTWRNKVLNMFSEAKRVIEDEYSPSDTSCGGHITLSCKGLSGEELCDKVRPFAGIIYALYKYRLRNSYCYGNLMMSSSSNFLEWDGHTSSSKYHVCKVNDNTIEFRLPSRVKSVEDMNLRYRLMYELVNYAVNHPNGTYASFIKRIRPILVHMYKGDTAKVDEVVTLSKAFRKMLLSGKINADVRTWVDKWGRLTSCYTESLRREFLR